MLKNGECMQKGTMTELTVMTEATQTTIKMHSSLFYKKL